MSGMILHQGAIVQCSHGGSAAPTAPNPRVTVSGQQITTQTPPYAVSGCPNPPVSGGPCIKGDWMTASVRVTAGGTPVLLMSSQAVTTPNGVPLTVVQAQTRVTAQ